MRLLGRVLGGGAGEPAHRHLMSGEPLVVRGPRLCSGDSETVSTAQLTVVYSGQDVLTL